MRFRFIYLLLFIFLFTLSACGQSNPSNGENRKISDNMVYTDQNHKHVALRELNGKVWVADFVFTSCTDICPAMTANLARLQDMMKKKGIENVQFVSFSVDPTVDTPQALKTFANKFHVDQTNWSFLTGYSQDYIENFARESFKTLVKKPQQGDQVIHGTDFYIVGPDGKIKEYYSGYKQVQFDEIIHDIQLLQKT